MTERDFYENNNVVDECLCGRRRENIPDSIYQVGGSSDAATAAYYYRCPACQSYSAVNLHFEPSSYAGVSIEDYSIHLDKRYLNRARVIWIQERFEYFPSNPVIFDLGSGEGAFTEALKRGFPSAAITAVEADGRMRDKFTDEYQGVTFVEEYIEPFLARHELSADLIVLTDVLEHVIDPRALLRLIARALRPGMIAYITAPNGGGYHQARPVAADAVDWQDANITRQHLWMLAPSFMMSLVDEVAEIRDYSRTFETVIRRDSDYSTFLIRRPP